MGGFSNTIANFARETIENTGAKLATKFGPGIAASAHDLSEKVESGLYHAVFKPEAAFKDIPAANKLWEAYKGPYKELVNKHTAEGVSLAIKTGSNQPIHEIESEARKKASDAVFGPKHQVIQGVLKHVEKTVSKNRADIISDHLNILFNEAPIKGGPNEGKSSFDVDMRGSKKNPDAGFAGPTSKYRDSSESFIEKTAKVHQAILAYKAAIPHLASNLNILISDGFSTYAKALATNFGPGRKAAEAMVLSSNALSEVWVNGYREKQAFEAGIIHQFAPGSVGEFIHRNMYIPGMQRVRYETLMMSAHASKFAAEHAIEELKAGNTRYALPMFKELGLDHNKIAAQGYQLAPDDIQKVYYHGTDTRAFLSQKDNRSIISQRSPIFRIAGAFHNYVASQSKFLRATFKRQYEQGDFVGIGRNIALLSMAFPVLGATIYESERLLSGNDWDDPAGHLEKRVEATPAGMAYDAVTGKNNATSGAQAALATIENLSHLASFGVATGYIRGATRSHLANQILGPDANMLVQGLEDVQKALHTSNKKPDAWKPLARDIMSDTPSLGLGQIAAHRLLPTKTEEARGKPKKFRRSRPKPEDNNPFNATDFKY
jgi:hypothetical protein